MTVHKYENPVPFTKDGIPEPVFDKEPGFVEFYWKAWESAWNHILENETVPQSPYIDEGFNPNIIWIWDTCFMVLFCRYASEKFPGIESFENFYAPFHDGVRSGLPTQHVDNPPLFAWIEYEYFKMTGNKDHLNRIFEEKQYLQKHFEYFDSLKQDVTPGYAVCQVKLQRVEDGYLWSGTPSGMDNTPRGRDDYDSFLWVDALAQQALSALYISRIAELFNDDAAASEFRKRYEEMGDLLNSKYWDKEDGIYYDVSKDDTSKHVKVKTVASFWPMLAEVCDEEQAKLLAEHILNPEHFGGKVPYTTVARNDQDYCEDGRYWRGSVWLPTAYMTIKALDKYGYGELADDTSYQLLEHMYRAYVEYDPHTIWEAYNPEEPKPAFNAELKPVRPDFCGWSALGPISLFIENVLGFADVDAVEKKVIWRKHQEGRHGVRNLKFGTVTASIIADGDTVEVEANEAFTLTINGKDYEIEAGKKTLKL